MSVLPENLANLILLPELTKIEREVWAEYDRGGCGYFRDGKSQKFSKQELRLLKDLDHKVQAFLRN